MCYRILADAEKDVSKLSSVKESLFTPREDISAVEKRALMSESGAAAKAHELLSPFSEVKGGIWESDEIDMKSGADTREVEKVD